MMRTYGIRPPSRATSWAGKCVTYKSVRLADARAGRETALNWRLPTCRHPITQNLKRVMSPPQHNLLVQWTPYPPALRLLQIPEPPWKRWSDNISFLFSK